MFHSRECLILGIGGQDGLFLNQLLQQHHFSVTGVLLPSDMSSPSIPQLLETGASLIQCSITDDHAIRNILSEKRPAHVFNLAGISFIPYSWDAPREVEQVNGFAVGQILHLIKELNPETRFFQACSSEMFGHNPVQSPQNEHTVLAPDNPYGSSKVFAYHLTKNYREHYGLFACSGILYNHESEWRAPRFVSRKITMAAAAIKLGIQGDLELGTLNTVRDWSYAGDIVQAMWLMVNSNAPRDYVLASGTLHSVGDVVSIAFNHVELDWHDHVHIDESLIRPPEGLPLCGDSTKARKELGWQPRVGFEEMIRLMVEKDLERLRSDR